MAAFNNKQEAELPLRQQQIFDKANNGFVV